MDAGEEPKVPAWVEHVIWWHVYPLGFTGAEADIGDRDPRGGPARVAHRLPHLLGWLDYAVDLGANGLALGPVFASGSHGYDTTDHYRIDPRLGDEADFSALADAAHARGLRVLLDGVFNHVGTGFPAFRRALEQGPGAPEAAWFRLDWPAGWQPGTEPGYATFEGHPGLVALNHDEPAVASYVASVMSHWLRAGADGWRLDAAYAVPASFWARVLPRVRAAHPEAYFVGEVIHGDYAAIVNAAGLDSVTQYELWKAIWSAVNDRNFFELAWALGRHDEFLSRFAPLTFTGNHDVTRLASRLSDARHLAHALVILFTVGGTPSVYYGDEQGFRGVKQDRAGGDDAVRPAFPAAPAGLPPDGWPVYRLHQELIGLRRRHPWLHRARTEQLHLANEVFIYQVGEAPAGEALAGEALAGDRRLVVALSLADGENSAEIPGAGDVLAGQAAVAAGPPGEAVTVTLPPHGWAILSAG